MEHNTFLMFNHTQSKGISFAKGEKQQEEHEKKGQKVEFVYLK